MAATCVSRKKLLGTVLIREIRANLRIRLLHNGQFALIRVRNNPTPTHLQACQSSKICQSVSHQTVQHVCPVRSIHHLPTSPQSSAVFLDHTRNCLRLSTHRDFSTRHDVTKVKQPSVVDPFKLVEKEMSSLAQDIRGVLDTKEALLSSMSHHFFDGKGKSFRPLVSLLMSKACNAHNSNSESLLASQRIVSMVVEMIHAASLVHDDVIDASDTRRGQPSLNHLHGQRQSILTGDYILSQASIALAKTGNPQVIIILSTILEDLVKGEFMQLGSKEDENERFSHYLKKTYRKTASLIAKTCQAVAILSGSEQEVSDAAFSYGRNLGVAFQLVDDLLDFTSTDSTMGKPTAADLKLGLATAPVLFAAQEHPELHAMIMRRFTSDGDVEYARRMVAESDGVEQTRVLAEQHSKAAIRSLKDFSTSDSKNGLISLANMLLDRKK